MNNARRRKLLVVLECVGGSLLGILLAVLLYVPALLLYLVAIGMLQFHLP